MNAEPKNLITIENGDGSLRSQFVISEQLASGVIIDLRFFEQEGYSVYELCQQKNGTS